MMVLLKMIAFVVLKILHNLVSMQKSADVRKIRKSAQPNLTFILVVLLKAVISFA